MLDSAFTFDAQLFDAKQQYANNVDGLNRIISEIINYEQSGPFSDVSGYIKDRLGFKPAGQVISSGGNTEIQTYNVDTGKLELDLDFKIVEGSQSIGGLTLINGAEFVVITNPNPPASSNVSISWIYNNDAQLTLTLKCTPGSSPTFTLSVVEVLSKCPADVEMAFNCY